MDKTGFLWPAACTHFLQCFHAYHEVTIFFNIRRLQAPTVRMWNKNVFRVTFANTPQVDDASRYVISRVPNAHNTFRIIAKCGYNDVIPTKQLSDIITWQLKCWLIHESEGLDIRVVDEAHKAQTVFMLGKESLTSKPDSGKIRRVFLGIFIWLREQATSKASAFHLPTEQVVEVGLVREI